MAGSTLEYKFTTRELAELMHKLHRDDFNEYGDPEHRLDMRIQKELLYVGKEPMKKRICACEVNFSL